MDLKYVPGPQNPADAISRAPHLEGESLPSISEVEFDRVMEDLDDKQTKSVVAFAMMMGTSEWYSTHMVCTVQTQPGHRSARLQAKEGGNAPAPTPEPLPPKWPPDMNMAKLLNLRNLARSGGIPPRQIQPEIEPETEVLDVEKDLFGSRFIDISTEDVQEATMPESNLPNGEGKTVRQQVEERRARDMNIDTFLSKVIEGYTQDKWFGKLSNMDKVKREKEFLFKEHALALPDFGGVRQAAMYQMHDAPWAGHVGRERTDRKSVV